MLGSIEIMSGRGSRFLQVLDTSLAFICNLISRLKMTIKISSLKLNLN